MEYLLLDVPVSSPLQPLATFSILEGDRKQFPVGNRMLESSLQVNIIIIGFVELKNVYFRISTLLPDTLTNLDLQSSSLQSLIFMSLFSWLPLTLCPLGMLKVLSEIFALSSLSAETSLDPCMMPSELLMWKLRGSGVILTTGAR